jgi:hypothetical protein
MRRVRPLFVGLAGLAAVVFAAAPTDAAVQAASSRETQAQHEIAVAFRALAHLPSVARGRTTLQGFDPAMWQTLEQAGTQLLDGQAKGQLPRVSEHTGSASIVSPGEATVPLTITVTTKYPPPSYSLHYLAVALESHGRWQVSWTTMCMLVESAHELCPPTPEHVEAGNILPVASGGPLDSTSLSPGLVNPGPLAVTKDGGVLIADTSRNQILEWNVGVLTVVAGDGLQGFGGDGGPAVDAELDGPGEIAVGPTGTIYFVDSGNDRIRAITPGGTMETVAGDGSVDAGANVGDGGLAIEAPLNPSGLAVSPAGVLYVSSNSAIREVDQDGIISTLVQGGPPDGVDVQVGGAPEAFFPDSLALDGQGDVIVFSFSPKELFSVGPTGRVSALGPNYATALSTAPDGGVLVAEHNPGLDHVTGTTMAALPFDTRVPGVRYPLVAEGIAEGADGTTYIDSEPGDGFTDQTGLYEVTDGVARPVRITSTLESTLPAVGAPGFPAATYPATAPSQGTDAALPSCPSAQGVTSFTPAAETAARSLLGFWNTGFSYDLHASDRSWWPGVVGNFTGTGSLGRQTVGDLMPATDSLYAPAIAAACGQALVKDSVEVVMGASPYDFSYQHVFLLDRDGSPLVYFSDA